MNKRLVSRLKDAVIRFARKFVIPIGLALMCFAPNCVYAYSTEVNEWQNVQIYGGGMITGVTFSEAEENLIYARTDMGGIYRWQEDTKSWKPLTDWVGPEMWSNIGCDGIATDPTDPNRVYALMGEYDNGWTDVPGAVFCSNDKGETWEVVELPFFCGSNRQGRLMGDRLVVDPNNNSNLYLASRNDGLWKSEDYGRTWKEVSSFPTQGTFKYDKGTEWEGNLGLTWVLCDKNSNEEGLGSQTIYVGVGDQAHSIYRSKDGGETWEPLPNEPRGKVTNEATGEWKIEEGVTYLPYQSYLTKEGILYVTYSTTAGPYDTGYGDVWKFDTNTDKWTLISPKSSKTAPGDPWYPYNGIAVDPQNEDHIVVISQSWWPDILMYRSTDGGETWNSIWEWTNYPNRKLNYNIDISDAPWLDWGTSGQVSGGAEVYPKLGWCVGAIDIDPFNSDRLMYGTGATLYGTDNLTNWDRGEQIDITVMVDGIEEAVTNALMVVPSKDDGLISSLWDINGFYHDDVTKVPTIMANVKPGDKYSTLNSSVAMDYAELNPSIVVRVGERKEVDGYGNYLNGLMWSKDGGKTFSPISSRIGNSVGGGKVALSADGSIVVWATPDEPVSWSNGGYNWTDSTGIPTGAKIASDRVNPKVFYGYKDGKAYVSTDSAKTFTTTEVDGLPSLKDMNIKAVRGHEGNVWMGTSKATNKNDNGLWFSEDFGKTYRKLSDVDSVTSFGFGKGREDSDYEAIYIVGKVEGQDGFFRSDDKGESWTRINDDNHQYGLVDPGCDVAGDPDVYGRVYIGTNGRGIVYADTGSGTVVVSAKLSKVTADFDKKPELAQDVEVTITPNGKTLQGIKAGDTVLTEGVDYTISDQTVTILKTYLTQQENGSHPLIFDFDEGKDPVLTIHITQTTIQSSLETTAATFNKEVPEAISIKMNLLGNELKGLQDANSNELIKDIDFIVEDENVILQTSYLEKLSEGKHVLTFNFSEGNAALFEVNVVEKETPQIKDSVVTPKEIHFDKYEVKQADITLDLALNGNALETIVNASTVSGDISTLSQGSDYQLEDNHIILLASYLNTLDKGAYELTFSFSAGAEQVVHLEVVDTTPDNPTLPEEGVFDLTLSSSSQVATNTLSSTFKVKVVDEGKYDLSKLAIRYYFTADQSSVMQNAWVDSAAMQYTVAPWYVDMTRNIEKVIVKMAEVTAEADTYLELSFTDQLVLDSTGTLSIATRIANENWTNFDQSNDFSYNDASHVAIFYDGVLVGGSIPQ